MKAIETHYKGYRFRSRLEARWAVFFDQAGIRYEYEPEGFILDGEKYLPDFRLSELGVWFEVKGPYPTEREKRLVQALSRETQSPCLMANGPIDISCENKNGYCSRNDVAGIGVFMGELWQTWTHPIYCHPMNSGFLYPDGVVQGMDTELFTLIGVPREELNNELYRRFALENYIEGMESSTDAVSQEIALQFKAGRRSYQDPWCVNLDNTQCRPAPDYLQGYGDWQGGRGMVFDEDPSTGSISIKDFGSSNRIKNAYWAAMQSRFEHGETPR